MRRFVMAALVAAMVLAGLAGGARAEDEHGGKIDWVRDPAVGFAKARLEGRTAMLYFSAVW
jgi:hypothetical protein